MKKIPLVLAVAFFLVQCNEQQAPKASTEAVPATPVFQLSTSPPPPENDRAANWCYNNYSNRLIINAETVNTNRRYFFLPPGITFLGIGPSKSSATLLLRPLPNGNVEVFTGSNYPHCLSSPTNLNPKGGAMLMRYDNNKNIDFQLELASENGSTKITVEFNPGAVYAITASHCLECQ